MYTLIIEDKHGGIADEYTFEEGEYFVGRSHTSDIILPSDNVSRRHARLYTVDGVCYVEDLNSSNGVFVNGRRLQEVYQVKRSARIKIGDFFLHIESDKADPSVEKEQTYALLTGQNLSFTGQVFRLQNKVALIGRGRDCTVTLIDPSVSRIHAKISVMHDGSLSLEDLKSSNGTFVNGQRVTLVQLSDRDLVQFGNVKLQVGITSAQGGNKEAVGEWIKERAETSAKRARDAALAGEPSPPAQAAAIRDAAPRSARKRSQSQPAAQPAPQAVVVDAPLAASYQEEDAFAVEELWPQNERRKKRLILAGMALAVVALVLIFTGVFSSKKESKPPEVAEVAVVEAEEKSPEPSQEDRLEEFFKQGSTYVRDKEWIKAKLAFESVLEIDPLHEKARAAVNSVILWKIEGEALEEAKKLESEKAYGKAAKKLREIGDTSVYFGDAQKALSALLQHKGELEKEADELMKSRDCDDAMKILTDLLDLSPEDSTLVPKIDMLQQRKGTRRCK